jgi:hypothetical protein
MKPQPLIAQPLALVACCCEAASWRCTRAALFSPNGVVVVVAAPAWAGWRW